METQKGTPEPFVKFIFILNLSIISILNADSFISFLESNCHRRTSNLCTWQNFRFFMSESILLCSHLLLIIPNVWGLFSFHMKVFVCFFWTKAPPHTMVHSCPSLMLLIKMEIKIQGEFNYQTKERRFKKYLVLRENPPWKINLTLGQWTATSLAKKFSRYHQILLELHHLEPIRGRKSWEMSLKILLSFLKYDKCVKNLEILCPNIRYP